jgi:uncharacterized protein YbjT (DUF2867 family)
VDTLRSAMSGVSTLFLLNGVVADEYTQALIALNVAREAGIERIVYLSVIHSDIYVDVPHFAGKFGVERMIEQMSMNATILRPAYYMDNEITIKDVVTGWGIGAALREAAEIDPRFGGVLNNDLAEYVVPVNADIGTIDVGFIDQPDLLLNQAGVKGLDEVAMAGVAAAIGNAIFHATGRRLRELPMRMEHLL